MKTYAETQDELPFDWNVALADPPAQGSPYHKYLVTLAASWVTCACGNQCDLIPRHIDGVPKDIFLGALGSRFSRYVYLADWDKAREMLREIEQRSHELLEQLRTQPS